MKKVERLARVLLHPPAGILSSLLSKKSIGGQAVIEGVMMKGDTFWSVAVRGGNGVVHIKTEGLLQLHRYLKLPVLRGIVGLGEAVVLGIKAIDFSATKALDDEDGKPMSPVTISITIAVALALGILLFILLPLYLTKVAGVLLPLIKESSLFFNLIDGITRVLVFLLYIFLVGLWGEMRRVYEYHGAEHKVIHAYESGDELIAERIAERYSPQHPRCGTSFLLIVMILSILVFSAIPRDWDFVLKFLSRILLIPLIAGLSYEILRVSARKSRVAFVNMFVSPGLMLQRLTTREPDSMQIEVALSALREVAEDIK